MKNGKVISASILVIFLSLFSTCVLADEASEHLKSLLTPISSMQANFSQTVKNQQGKVLQSLSGKVTLKKPGQFRWEVVGRDPRLVIADGKEVWDYDKDLEQVSVQKLEKGQTRAPIYFLTGDVNALDQDFTVTELSSKKCLQNSDQCFELKPKKSEGAFQWIRIGFKSKKLNEMEMLDQLGQYSRFSFKNVTLNSPIPANIFKFTPPKGVDVLRNR